MTLHQTHFFNKVCEGNPVTKMYDSILSTSGGRPKSFSSSGFLHARSSVDAIQKYVALDGRLTALWT